LKKIVFLAIFIVLILFGTPFIYADNYYVSNTGSDDNPGTDPLKPWRSMAKVNTFKFKPGDRIYFKRGGVWQDSLVVQSGEANAYMEYGAYGLGPKPVILGSLDKSKAEDWVEESPNIWTLAGDYSKSGKAANLTPKISMWKQDGADAKGTLVKGDSNKLIYQLQCISPGNSEDDIQLSIGNISIEQGKSYKLDFWAKSSEKLEKPSIELLESKDPWSDLAYSHRGDPYEITTEWTKYSITYIPWASDTSASIVFHIGKKIYTGEALYLSDVKFYEFKDEHIYNDVGNIIYNDGEVIGEKVSQLSQLKKQDQFCYEAIYQKLSVYSEDNPALKYSKIDCAISKDIISVSDKSYINIKDLDIRYGSACGIYGENAHHINISGCDISFIGGSYLMWEGKIVRYGNGITFYNSNHDINVERCRIWDIYDTGVTNQGKGYETEQYNISYRNNTIWNCEYSFEYWNLYSHSETRNVYFENNVCSDAGYGWSHNQREIQNGIHVLLSSNMAETSNIIIRNNTFKNAKKVAIYLSKEWNGLDKLILDDNVYMQPEEGYLIWHDNDVFRIEDYRRYQVHLRKEYSSQFKVIR